MTLEVPPEVKQHLDELDASNAPIEDDRSMPVGGNPLPGTEWTKAQRKGAFAEVVPWQFRRPNRSERTNRWGTYWSELAILEGEGRRVYVPDADEVDAEVIRHWMTRAGESKHPVLRARYADVAWDIGRYLRKKGKASGDADLAALVVPVEVVHIAIDAYLDAVERRLTDDNSTAWKYLSRAIELSLSIKDQTRLGACRTALLALREAVRATDADSAQTWRFYDIAEEHFADTFKPEERAAIIADLQAELRMQVDMSDPKTFNPHSAADTSERLQRWARIAGDRSIGVQAVKDSCAAFEQAAEKADGMLAIAWLEDLIHRYRSIGDSAGATRVEQTIRKRAPEMRAQMKSHSVSVEIPREEFDQFAEKVCGESLEQALALIAVAGLRRYEAAVESVKAMLEEAPLFSTITMTLTGADGFTEARVGGVDDDIEGRAIQHAGQMMVWQAGMLGELFRRIREKYQPTSAQLADCIEACPFFGHDRRPLLERGLQAWLDGDGIVASHLLVPQLEAALREMCVSVGGSVMTPNERHQGYRVAGMGAILTEPHLMAVLHSDMRFQLRALLTDPRGLSARNHIAHGIAQADFLSIGLCNWIVHAMLLVAQYRLQSPAQ